MLSKDGATVADVYRLRYGVRTVEASLERGFLINGRPFYFAGFGKHEDSELRGRGLDLPQLVKDMGLLQWTGANSVRASPRARAHALAWPRAPSRGHVGPLVAAHDLA